MYDEKKLAKAKDILKKNNQEKILMFLNKLDDGKKESLAEQILNLDFEQLNRLYAETKTEPEILEKKIEHTKYVDEYKISEEIREKYTKLGENVIKNNQYAVVTMAGGQGTRLGHKGPKGTFLLDVIPEPKYLFQILAENLEKANRKYGVTLPWFVMTSTENNEETVKFFKEHNYFGYPEESIEFFEQGNLPLLSFDGSLILDKDCSIKEAADGNGCIYAAMAKAGVIEKMKKMGIKWIFIGSVDNALLNMVDPILVGLTIDQKHEIASKSVAKANPHERVGVFCKINSVPSVIEYSELPEKMAEETDKDGELLYGEAHIMCNLFSIDALEKVSKVKLPYHVAVKKSGYMDENLEFIEAGEPNAYKFEAFIFDAFNFFDDISILRGKREFDFAPVKNKAGNDSPDTARALYNNLARCKIENLYNLDETIAKELLAKYIYPWEVLPHISDFILELGEKLPKDEYKKIGEDVWIHKSATVFETAYIHGPAIICKDAEIRHCAFIRGKAIVGEGAVVGNSTELKNVILFNKVQVPHYNYVGDSILGYKAHMGAGSITSNVKSDKKLVKIKCGNKQEAEQETEQIETGLKKIGAMLGDNVEVGCGSVLNPGTIIGKNTNIYPLSSVRGVVPANSIYKSKTGTEIVEKK